MSTKADKLEKLRKLRAAKNGKIINDDDEYEDNKLYDEIDEKEYRSRKRQELLQDDFVVDDDGLGYVDNGIENDTERSRYYSAEEDEEDLDTPNKKKKNKKANQIDNMIRSQHSKKMLSAQLAKEKKKSIKINAFDDILDDFEISSSSITQPSILKKQKPIKNQNIDLDDDLLFVSAPSSATKRSFPIHDKNVTKKQKKIVVDIDTLESTNKGKNGIYSSPLNSQKFTRSDIENSPTLNRKVSREASKIKDEDKSEDLKEIKVEEDDDDDDIMFGRRTIRSVTTTKKVTFDSKSNQASSPFVTAPGTPSLNPNSSPLKSSSYSRPQIITVKKCQKDSVVDSSSNTFKMFWTDYSEVDNTLVLFGKTLALDGSLVSTMVQITDMYRELYFLPRDDKTPQEVHDEIIPLLMGKYGLDSIRAKPEHKKYAFELPGIPKETDYLKVLLPYKTPKSSRDLMPPDLSSDTFHHVFGGSTNIFESWVVQNKIMGPCWLEIKDGDFQALQNASHCQLEVLVDNPKNITTCDKKDMVDLNCVSISVQTVMNPKENKQEIVSISLSYYNNMMIDSPIPEDLPPSDIVTLIRPPSSSTFPLGLGTAGKQKLQGQLRLFKDEKTLLMCFAAMLKVADPDVIIGHRLESVILDVLAHRMFDLKIPSFSSLGRRVRREWPDRFGKNNNGMSGFLIRDICSGRLLCDISNEMGQSLTMKCQSWELTEMYKVTCGKDHTALDINYNNKQYQDDMNSIVMALQENVTNSLITAEVSFRIQLLSLTKQLTILAGNAWSQTLGGTRAGRNEFILLHEFYRNNYILPDKETKQQKAQRKANNDNGDAPSSSKKAKYQGGLVFDPEKGLHKNYILVMDFNSLYPSIIQEFNICFTTVNRDPENIDELPDVPESDKAQGVLPRLLATLVERRREIKKIMATEKDPHKKMQCDIRQQALKLTANSMYGCLGYVNSRFYAKPLAMLTTNKGREILMNTRQLAESLELSVVYGDTDSVMIDTGCLTYAEAIKIGQDFKKLVNERYRLLEIDIDNVFKKLLLHAKKKYAALNVNHTKDGKEFTVLEIKGLDMRRREFCPLSKEISTHVLNIVLSDKDSETALGDIYEYLEAIRKQIENNEIMVSKYKINTKLSKDPNSYPNKKTMPAVQVALKMRKVGRVVKAGSVISFVITKGKNKDDDDKDEHVADRAYALSEVMNKSNNLVPDPHYYLEKQIFSPVERLLERIESFDVVRLSESLGLDSKKYIRRATESSNSIDNLQPLETTISDEERFNGVANLELVCPNCTQRFLFGGIVGSNFYNMTYNGLQCKKCEHTFSCIQITSQLERCIRAHISLYYAGWLLCDDRTCGIVTRQLSVFGKRCLNDGCTGVMRYQYSDKQLYNQLLYLDSLFDHDKNKNQEIKPIYYKGDADYPDVELNESSIKVLVEQNRELFEINRSVVKKYLDENARAFVDMGSIFDFMQD